jgi:hypothetical protein
MYEWRNYSAARIAQELKDYISSVIYSLQETECLCCVTAKLLEGSAERWRRSSSKHLECIRSRFASCRLTKRKFRTRLNAGCIACRTAEISHTTAASGPWRACGQRVGSFVIVSSVMQGKTKEQVILRIEPQARVQLLAPVYSIRPPRRLLSDASMLLLPENCTLPRLQTNSASRRFGSG